MKYVALSLLIGAGAVHAQSDGIGEATRPTPAAYSFPRLPDHIVLKPGVCDPADAPLQWLDASDPSTFAGSSLAQLSNDDSAFLRLRALVQLRVTVESLRLLVLGASPNAWEHLQIVPREGRWKTSSC